MKYPSKYPLKYKAQQAGFSLIELLVALVIITILATAISAAFDGTHSRAQALVVQMTEVGNANIRLKNDTGCYVSMPEALYDPASAAAPSNNYCGSTFGMVWNGPYVNRFTPDASGNATVPKVSANAVLSYGQTPSPTGGVIYYVHANLVPNDIVKQAMQTCNDTDDMTVTFATSKCMGALSTSGLNGTFDMQYDETR